jgi:[acyl-carrier-protein] S-malonyltransferase
MTPTAILFPGQGSLTPDSAEQARDAWPELVERACDLAGEDVFEGAQHSTALAQPAIFVSSISAWRERREDVADIAAMAGHSLGELSALAAAGAIDVYDALRLVVLRGRLMARAAREHGGEGGMVAVLGGTPERARELALDHGLVVANDNAPGQIVLSGDRAAIEALTPVARGEGFKTLVLDVAGAFHSPGIAAAEAPFLAASRAVAWGTPAVPVVSGFSTKPFTDFPLELARALVSAVRWREVMATLYALGAREFIDVGPGRVLARLVARNIPALEEHALTR